MILKTTRVVLMLVVLTMLLSMLQVLALIPSLKKDRQVPLRALEGRIIVTPGQGDHMAANLLRTLHITIPLLRQLGIIIGSVRGNGNCWVEVLRLSGLAGDLSQMVSDVP
jgi:hypothetical protein